MREDDEEAPPPHEHVWSWLTETGTGVRQCLVDGCYECWYPPDDAEFHDREQERKAGGDA